MRVLVVEDEERIAADVSAALSAAGYLVDITATKGTEHELRELRAQSQLEAASQSAALAEAMGLFRAVFRSSPIPLLLIRHDDVEIVDAQYLPAVAKQPFGGMIADEAGCTCDEKLHQTRPLLKSCRRFHSAEQYS